MTALSPLPQLAALAGIETRYRDVWGHEREVPDNVIAALLEAMGMRDLGSPEKLARDIRARRWHRLCNPAVVLPEEAAHRTVPVHLPRDGQALLEWHLLDEAGGAREGRIAPAEAALAGAADAGAEWGVETRLLPLPDDLPASYYALTLECGADISKVSLIVAPPRCYLPPDLETGRRAWGLTTQLYALRSARNWGIGDFSDLGALGIGAARHGARALGVNPLHALFAAEPRHVSPYSPSSRLFLNDLYIDPEAAPDFAESAAARALLDRPETRSLLAAARQAELVDHVAVAELKREAFASLYRCFRERHLGAGEGSAHTGRGEAFRAYQAAGGEALRDFATFEALHGLNLAAGNGFSWREWEIALQNPRSPEVAAFAAANLDRIEQVEYLQWEADRQLGEAARRGADSGLSIGLYRDLAVGVDPHGAAAWADQELLVPGASVGAPPDLLNMKGQDWGLAPIDPLVLRRRGYAPFIASLRANMRHAGALRIDHVMALQHVYWVPRGMPPAEGGYIAYPFEDLVRILALESHRQRCAVIGEDLGTVPVGFRERMHDANILSYRVLIFERRADGSFIAPDQYPELATASAATHDLATFRGYWTGRDLEWRRELDLYATAEQRAADIDNRARERRLLLDALVREGVLPPDAAGALLGEGGPEYTPALVAAVHRYLGKTSARLVLVQIEDAVGELEQVNLPGTLDEHPNWRRKLSLTVEEILHDPAFAQLAQAVNEARGGAARGHP